MRRWLVVPLDRDTNPIAPGFPRWTYASARRTANLLNTQRANLPEVYALPWHRWVVIDRRAR